MKDEIGFQRVLCVCVFGSSSWQWGKSGRLRLRTFLLSMYVAFSPLQSTNLLEIFMGNLGACSVMINLPAPSKVGTVVQSVKSSEVDNGLSYWGSFNSLLGSRADC